MTGALKRLSQGKLNFNPHEREARDPEFLKGWILSNAILIHTSVKLVTGSDEPRNEHAGILIHTSVKLVTPQVGIIILTSSYFNPHEREARDPFISFIR